MGMREESVPNMRAAIDGHKTVQYGVAADAGPFVDEAVGANVSVRADLRRGSDDRRGMNAGGVLWGTVNEINGASKIEIGIGRSEQGQGRQARLSFESRIPRHDDRGGKRRLYGLAVAGVGDERQLPLRGLGNSGDTVNLNAGISLELASQALGDLFKSHQLLPGPRYLQWVKEHGRQAFTLHQCCPAQNGGAGHSQRETRAIRSCRGISR